MSDETKPPTDDAVSRAATRAAFERLKAKIRADIHRKMSENLPSEADKDQRQHELSEANDRGDLAVVFSRDMLSDDGTKVLRYRKYADGRKLLWESDAR